MQQININELKEHPRNNEFFDDITGEKWKEFLESIKKRGVVEPIVITPDKVIVSGHQRVRACKELGIHSVMCDVHTYNNEDEILQDLLETNIRQRGDVGGSAKKVGLRIKELERLYGIQNGATSFQGNQHNEVVPKNSEAPTQVDLASQMGISVDTLNNYKRLTEMIPELEDLVDTGIVTKSTALAMMKNLTKDEQEEMISSMDTTKRITQKKVQEYIDQINYLKSHPTVTVKEPDDYRSTKKRLAEYKEECASLQSQFQSKTKEVQDLRKQIENIKVSEPVEQYSKKLKDDTIFFCSKVADFIEKVGGYAWLTDHINELPEYEKKSYIHAVTTVNSWAQSILNAVNE